MRAFRNRFRSFDAGLFPVLRLPLGNQPKLVDVLRAAAAKEDTPPPSSETQEEAPPEDDIQAAGGSLRRQSKAESIDHFYVDTLCDDVTPWPLIEGTQDPPETPVPGEEEEEEEEEKPLSTGSAPATCDSPGITIVEESKSIPVLPFSLSSGSPEASARPRDPPSEKWRAANGGGAALPGSARTWHPPGRGRRGLEGPSLDLCAGHRCHRRTDSLVSTGKEALTDPGEEPLPWDEFPDVIPRMARHGRKRVLSRPSLRAIAWDAPPAHDATPTPTSTPTPTLTPPSVVADCSYTCHEQCQDLVTLDCKADLTPDSQTSEEELYIEGTEEPQPQVEVVLQVEEVGEEEEEEEEAEEEEVREGEQVEEEEEEEEQRVDEVEEEEEEKHEKHEEEQQEKELKDELPVMRKTEEVSTLRKTVSSLQSCLVDNDTLEAWVERYNASAQGLQIAKESDGSYRGCVRVHLNLSRPINIVAGTRPPSIYDILQEDRTMEKTLTSFYMPRDAVKAIHITSKTTTREVIVALLRKFKVVDNPQKFALYERTIDTTQSGKAKLRRLGDGECPLVLALNWSAGGLTNKRLVLQENDTADIQWEAFSLPELSNFLRILDREEEEYRCQIRDKYALLRRRIHNILIQQEATE